MRITTAALICLLISAARCGADERIPADPPLRWWKGNIHTHSLWSDGNDFPEMIAEWYRTHGYHFLALSDHNILSEGQRWMPHKQIIARGGADALAKYQARFGGGWVETRGQGAAMEVRLKPLNEFRALVEDRGKFLLVQSEEISDGVGGKPVHLNVANVKRLVQPLGGATVREAIAANVRAVQDQARREGREMLVHLNHPNFGLAVTAEDLAMVVEERFFEVYNGHPAIKHLGDKNHPRVEMIWDIANTLRLAKLDAPPLYGVATDDSHKYHGESGSRPGRGWVQVQSRYLTPDSLIKAMKRGQFYASSGVTLAAVEYQTGQQAGSSLRLRIEPQADATYVTQFVGTRRLADAPEKTGPVGEILATESGLEPSYTLRGDEYYVRAVVTSSLPHPDPSFVKQMRQAWTQPVGWKGELR